MTQEMAPRSPLVAQLEGIHKRFRQNPVLEGIDLSLEAGDTLAILGGSGTGKSVLLKILMGLLQADQGRVRLFGTDATDLDEVAWEPLRRRSSMLFQAGALFDSMSVFENVAFPLVQRRVDRDRIRQIVQERLEWVELPEIGSQRPVDLSGGMRKRVALARAIATDPELILYDEPTTGLDPLTGKKIAELIRSLNNRLGSTSIVVTHDIVCAGIVADRWIFLAGGRVLAEGSPAQMRQSGPPEVQEFLQAAVVQEGAAAASAHPA